MVIRWRHFYCLQSWPPGSVTCVATSLPWIALLSLSVSIDLVSSSTRVTSVKSTQGVVLSDGHLDPKIGPQETIERDCFTYIVFCKKYNTICWYDNVVNTSSWNQVAELLAHTRRPWKRFSTKPKAVFTGTRGWGRRALTFFIL